MNFGFLALIFAVYLSLEIVLALQSSARRHSKVT